MISSKWLSCAVGTALVLGLTGCGGSDEPASAPAEAVAPEAVAPPPVEKTAPGVTVTTKLPANFPSDIPMYPEADVVFSRASGDMALSVRFVTNASVDEVAGFYVQALASQGWSAEHRPSIGGAAVLANKGMRRAALSVSTNSGGKTQVDLMIAESPF